MGFEQRKRRKGAGKRRENIRVKGSKKTIRGKDEKAINIMCYYKDKIYIITLKTDGTADENSGSLKEGQGMRGGGDDG